MLSMDTSLKGNIIALLRDAKERPDDEWRKLSICINVFDVKQITEDSSRFRRKRKEQIIWDELLIEEDVVISDEEIDSIIDSRVAKYTTSNINDYILQFLAKQESVTVNDISLENDDEFLTAIFLSMNSSDYRREYSYESTANMVSKGRFKIPNFTIRKRGFNDNR
jgi:hypothetical protein